MNIRSFKSRRVNTGAPSPINRRRRTSRRPLTCGWNAFPPAGPPAPPAPARGGARFGGAEGDALGVQVLRQLGDAQADPGCFQASLDLGQDQRPVLQDLRVELGVGQDEGAHRPEAVLQARGGLRGGDVGGGGVGGGDQLWVGPGRRGGGEEPFNARKRSI